MRISDWSSDVCSSDLLGLRDTWIGLGALSLLLTALSWFGWPAANPPPPAEDISGHSSKQNKLPLRILYGQYAATALGLVPVRVLQVDYIARGLGRGATIGAHYGVLYGPAATIGPLVRGGREGGVKGQGVEERVTCGGRR